MSDHAPLREGGKSQAFDVEYQMPQKHASEVDSRGLRRSDKESYDDDGHVARTGGWVTAYAHIVTAVIGSGVLSLAWSMSWLGWPGGALCIFAFAWVTLYCSELLIDAYRYPAVDSPHRNHTYIEAVTCYLGRPYAIFCGIIQYLNMFATGVGYTLTAGVALTAVKKADCYHFSGTTKADADNPCTFSQTPWIIFMGALQIVLSQIQDIDRVWIMSVVATIMAFIYSFIGLGMSIGMATEHPNGTGSADGLWDAQTPATKTWGIFQALGSIAFAYSFSFILLEITDTLKSPGENGHMKRATRFGVATTTFFYASIGFIGYAAFGNGAPGNLISGFGFYKPFWLVDIANIAIFIHLLGAFQVWMQPLYGFVEMSLYKRFPGQAWMQYDLFATKVPGLGIVRLSPFRLVWRSITVVIITILALLLGNCFNDVIAFLGAIGFAPLTVFLPIQMHIVQKKIPTWSAKWWGLHVLDVICWMVSIVAAIGSIIGIIADTQGFAPFQTTA